MIKTKIFIASSADGFKTDNLEIESFISRLNNCYVDRGLYFTPVLSADIKGADNRSREIADSGAAFFLLNAESNDDIRGIYRAAHGSYNKTGKPKISVYIKAAGAGTQDIKATGAGTQDIKAAGAGTQDGAKLLRDKLGAGADLHYNTYSHVDTLKLGILMQVKQLGLPGVDIRLEDGKAWQGADALLPLENVESVTGFESLQNLKQRRAELESRYYAAKIKYAENPDDTAAYDEFLEASKQRGDAIQEIYDIESQLYHMIEGMYIQTSRGKLSKRQAEGYRLIERGKLLEARTILDFDEIVGDGRKKDEAARQIALEAQTLVNELLQLKDINATLLDWGAVDDCYKEAVRLEENHNLPRRAAITLDPAETDYMGFLITQYRHDEAAQLGNRLLAYYQKPVSGLQSQEKSYLYNLLGIIYDETQRMSEAEDALNQSLAIRNSRADGDPDAIAKDIAIVYNNLGNVYAHSKRYNEALKAHKAALEIRKKLAGRNPGAFEEYLAYTYVNLSEVYREVEKYEESAGLMTEARDIFKKLAANKPDPHEEFLSQCYQGLGVTYTRLRLYAEAEKNFNAALDIQLRQMDNNPGIYEMRVAATHNEHGRMYYGAKRYPEAEEKLKAALKLYNRLAARAPEAFEPELAKCYANLGELYRETKKLSEAVDAINSAIRLYDKYRETNPAFPAMISEAQMLLNSAIGAQNRERALSLITPEEKEVALLLMEQMPQREIIRRLNISAAEVAKRANAVREKMSGMASPDPEADAAADEFGLTQREVDVLRGLLQGKSNAALASDLILSPDTVRIHVRSLLKKLSVDSRQDIIGWFDTYKATKNK